MTELVNTTGKMTSLVIAEITGKRHQHLMRDIRKMEEAWVNLGQSKFGLISYIDSQNRAKPMYELSKTECLYIATKFNDEARAKLVLRWQELEEAKQKPLTQVEIVAQSAQILLEQSKRIDKVESELLELQAKVTIRPEYYTIAGFGRLQGVYCGTKLASRLGRKASAICRTRNILTETTHDARYGEVKTYPKNILEEVFAMPL